MRPDTAPFVITLVVSVAILLLTTLWAFHLAQRQLLLRDVQHFSTLATGLALAFPTVSAVLVLFTAFSLILRRIRLPEQRERRILRCVLLFMLICAGVRWFTFGGHLAYTGRIDPDGFWLGSHGDFVKVTEDHFRLQQLREFFIPATWLTAVITGIVQLRFTSDAERKRMSRRKTAKSSSGGEQS